ncbi:MAG: DUF308 domain-containing protein [Butyricicoccus sp.]|nr:DUF308 domain-containing protein [Butyricicoccus sp.]
MKAIKFLKAAFVAGSAVFIASGVCLLIWPDISVQVICCVLGVAAVLYGIVKLLGYFSNDLYRLAFQFDLAVGVLTIVLGALLLIHPRGVIGALPVLLGVFILVESVLRLQTSLDAKHFGMRRWWTMLLLAVGGAALGIAMLLRPFESGRVLVRMMGAALTVDGAENLLAGLYTIKVPRRSERIETDEYTVT